MKKILLLTAVALSLAACGDAPSKPMSPEAKASAAADRAAWKERDSFEYGGKSYEIARMPNSKMVTMKGAVKGVPYTARDLERAATAHTGCKAKFEPGILSMIGGFSMDSNLEAIKIKKDGYATGWSLSLGC